MIGRFTSILLILLVVLIKGSVLELSLPELEAPRKMQLFNPIFVAILTAALSMPIQVKSQATITGYSGLGCEGSAGGAVSCDGTSCIDFGGRKSFEVRKMDSG